jgi:hypothetical protein
MEKDPNMCFPEFNIFLAKVRRVLLFIVTPNLESGSL